MGKQKPVRISLFGHFGSTNPGNEATLLAILSRLRVTFPEGELCCICTSPENVTAAHGIDAVPHTLRTSRIWNRQAPLRQRVRLVFRGLRDEAREYVRAWKTLAGQDLLIVPGTGLLTDALGLSGWGPYGLLKWSLLARLRGCRLMFVSVGAGPVHSRLGHVLLRSALVLAGYRSFRDIPSRTAVGSSTDPIYPDLVFGLSPASIPAAVVRAAERRVVGLGLMEYSASYSAPSPTGEAYDRYLDSLAVFVGWLLEQEYDVKLLLGDADTIVIDEFTAVLRKRVGSYPVERVTHRPINSVHDVLSQINETDFVVATRFHNVLMSLLLGRPALAISFHHKVSSLMSEMGLSAYCHDINQMNADALVEQFQALVRNADELRPMIKQRVVNVRLALDEQYQLLFQSGADQSVTDEVVAAS